METLTAALLNDKHGAIISPGGDVRVPVGWHAAVDDMLSKLADLPTDIRAFMMVVGIAPDDETGLLEVVIAANPDLMSPGGSAQVQAIVKDARDLCAWSCVNGGAHGWLVRTKLGPRVLCPDCQVEAGLEVKCYEV